MGKSAAKFKVHKSVVIQNYSTSTLITKHSVSTKYKALVSLPTLAIRLVLKIHLLCALFIFWQPLQFAQLPLEGNNSSVFYDQEILVL